MDESQPDGTIAVMKAPDDSFVKYILKKGDELYSPKEGSSCVLKIEPLCDTAFLQDTFIIYSLKNVSEIQLGEGDSQIDVLFDKCLETMKPKEKCILKASIYKTEPEWMNDINFDKKSIEVQFEIELLSYSEAKEPWQMTVTEKFNRAKKHKNKGSEWFQQGKILWAFNRYSRSIKYLLVICSEDDVLEDLQKEIDQLKTICYLNLAACQIKSKNFSLAVINCTKALEIDENNLKGLFRRGLSRTELQEYEKAQDDFNKALSIEPQNKAILEQIKILDKRVQILKQNYARSMKKLFN